MLLSKKTQAILKNFASINQSIVIKPGNVIETISNVKDVFARAKIDETFDKEIAIYDLNEFLAIIALFENPELDFQESSVLITQGNMRQEYRYADASIITTPPPKGVTLPSVEVTANITREMLSALVKAASLNNANALTFTNSNVKVWNSAVPNSNTFEITGTVPSDGDYELSVAVEKLRTISDDYEVNICAKGLAHFVGTQGVEYYIALMPNGRYSA